ncbi:NADH:flavin oxidoreductase/NADH oxidase [Candidatus Moduliflexus flocculans]|uniref:NADH:flavin oxidoreductase/NADH oxidase n=1 Tax=Candidatus Moduliflexus flocculans TaxID=1499966 RepID=A0A0S6VRW0_9BACT|nr:NADH:flavin oxidoreductase/NADH oxidase [Candidatus Moduliflexus flocculans]
MKINSIDGRSPERVFDACRYTCRHFAEKQMDAIEISGNVFDFPDTRINPYRESVLRDYADQIAEDVDIPIILVGLNRSCATMTEILNSTNIRYFSLSRPLIREPNLINLWQQNPMYVPQCLSCNQCFRPDGNTCIFE